MQDLEIVAPLRINRITMALGPMQCPDYTGMIALDSQHDGCHLEIA